MGWNQKHRFDKAAHTIPWFRSSHDDLMQALDAYFETGGAEGGAAAAAGGGLAADEEGPGDLVALTSAC